MEDSFLLFLIVGFLAQIVDGALGMAYGVSRPRFCWLLEFPLRQPRPASMLPRCLQPQRRRDHTSGIETSTGACSAFSHRWASWAESRVPMSSLQSMETL